MTLTLQNIPNITSRQKIYDKGGNVLGEVYYQKGQPPRFWPGSLAAAELQELADLMKRLEKTEAAIQAAKI